MTKNQMIMASAMTGLAVGMTVGVMTKQLKKPKSKTKKFFDGVVDTVGGFISDISTAF